MEAIYVLAIFGRYMADWKETIDKNKSWKRQNGRYQFQSDRLGLTLAMRFSEQQNVTFYECWSTSEKEKKVKELKSFQLEPAWISMWGKKIITPEYLIIYTRTNYRELLLKNEWKVDKSDLNKLHHAPSGTSYESEDDGTFNSFVVSNPGSVQQFLRYLSAIGLPINQNSLTHVG